MYGGFTNPMRTRPSIKPEEMAEALMMEQPMEEAEEVPDEDDPLDSAVRHAMKRAMPQQTDAGPPPFYGGGY